jgi:excinuclease ABC subunit C
MMPWSGILSEFPRSPGVYLMRDSGGQVIYVGKAKDLRARLSSYFRGKGDQRPLVRYLLKDLDKVEVMVTGTEKEALILENNLIKKHRPRYNVRFRDDKDYLHIRLDTTHAFPRLSVARRPPKDGALYFGPYASAHAARETVRLLQRHMGLRTCKDSQLKQAKRTCLNQQMGRCAGVCRGAISQQEYSLRVQEAVMFLQGRSRELIKELRARMRQASQELRFEEAARLRDQIRELERTIEAQRVDKPLGGDQDVVGLHRVGMEGSVALLRIRAGKVWERLGFTIPPTPLEDGEVLASFLQQFYGAGRVPPPRILVPVPLGENLSILESWLSELAGSRIRIWKPSRGEGRGLVEMAQENARLAPRAAQAWESIAQELAGRLGLRRPPRIIEAFDISNLGGEDAVGSAVRFVEGVAEPSWYRSYGVKAASGSDDYAMMYEVIRRHLLRKREEGALPDLIMVDGGKGQLGVAVAVMEDLGIKELDVIALAKARPGENAVGDRVFVPGRREPIPVGQGGGALRVLQRLRDEAHRFAIGRHRKRRGLRRLRSPLEGIPGVGPVRVKALLRHLGSLRRVEQASIQELSSVPGIPKGLAARIHSALHPRDQKQWAPHEGP